MSSMTPPCETPSEILIKDLDCFQIGNYFFWKRHIQKFPPKILELLSQIRRDAATPAPLSDDPNVNFSWVPPKAPEEVAVSIATDVSEREVLYEKPDVFAKIQAVLQWAEENRVGERYAVKLAPLIVEQQQSIHQAQKLAETDRPQELGTSPPVSTTGKKSLFWATVVGDFRKLIQILEAFVPASAPGWLQTGIAFGIPILAVPAFAILCIYGGMLQIQQAVLEARAAIRHTDIEGLVSLLKGIAGFGIIVGGMIAIVGALAKLGRDLASDLAKNIVHVTGLISNVLWPLLDVGLILYSGYRLLREALFGLKLCALFLRTGQTDHENAMDTLKWLKAQVTLDPLEALEIEARADKKGQDPGQALQEALQRKWDRFARRTNEVICKRTRTLLTSQFLQEVENGQRASEAGELHENEQITRNQSLAELAQNSENIDSQLVNSLHAISQASEAYALIESVAKQNFLNVVKYLVIFIAATIALVLTVMGHPGLLVVGIMLKVGFVLLTSSYLLNNLSGLYTKLGEKLWKLGEKTPDFFMPSTILSTSSDLSEDSPPTPLRPTAATSASS